LSIFVLRITSLETLEMWLWSEHIDETITQKSIKSIVLNYLFACLEIKTFQHIHLGSHCPSPCTFLPSHGLLPPP